MAATLLVSALRSYVQHIIAVASAPGGVWSGQCPSVADDVKGRAARSGPRPRRRSPKGVDVPYARRRVKTQGSLPTEDAALVLLFSLVASGQIKLRKIDGWQKIGAVLNQHTGVAA